MLLIQVSASPVISGTNPLGRVKYFEVVPAEIFEETK
jgi:hypothetical protein